MGWSDLLVIGAVIGAAWLVLELVTYGPSVFRELGNVLVTPFMPKPAVPTFDEAVVVRPFVLGVRPDLAAGKVRAAGSIWNAECPADDAPGLEVGARVRVDGCEGLTLKVRKG